MNIRETLPVHPLPDPETRPAAEEGALDVCGLVARSRFFSAAALAILPRERLTDRFVCEEGWAVERLAWEGISVRGLLAQCVPLPEARYVRVCAGPYWLAVPLSHLDQALLCDRLDDAPLTREHGAPWRLVLAGGACFISSPVDHSPYPDSPEPSPCGAAGRWSEYSGGLDITSVKWVSRLELAAELGAETAERIARDRLAGPGNAG